MARETQTYDDLFAGHYPVITERAIILSGENLARGTALGKVTASGKLKLLDSALSDGAETPYAILGEDVDASAGDKVGLVYLSGEFSTSKLTFKSGQTAAGFKAGFRDKNIYLQTSQQA